MLLWEGGKGPGENLPFDLDWSLRLAGDTITASTWSIVSGDAPASGTLVLGTSSFTTTMTQVWLSQGNLSQRVYVLENTVTTAAGDTLTEQVQLPMRNR
jgi:heme/copper-type cytochrome/quinol oxidase subunit 3